MQDTNHVEFEKKKNRDKEKGFSLSSEEKRSLLFDRKKHGDDIYRVGTKTPPPTTFIGIMSVLCIVPTLNLALYGPRYLGPKLAKSAIFKIHVSVFFLIHLYIFGSVCLVVCLCHAFWPQRKTIQA